MKILAVAALACIDLLSIGFSNNVYGEIKHSFVRDIIKHADIQPHHTFLDMVNWLDLVYIHECFVGFKRFLNMILNSFRGVVLGM